MRFFIVFLFYFFSHFAFAQAENKCVQNGGYAFCEPAELTYHFFGYKGKNYNELKEIRVKEDCDWFIKNRNAINCQAGDVVNIVASPTETPFYHYYFTIYYPNNKSETGKGSFNVYQNCPSGSGIENNPYSWHYYCRYYSSAYTPTVSKINSWQESPNLKGNENMCSAKGYANVGDPVDISTGHKYLSEIDYKYQSNQEFLIKRDYSSQTNQWSFYFERKLKHSVGDSEYITLIRPGGKAVVFKKVSDIWQEVNNSSNFSIMQVQDTLVVKTAQLDTEIYRLKSGNGDKKLYELETIKNYKNQNWNYHYENGFLKSIVDDYNRQYLFNYYEAGHVCYDLGRIKSITVPGNKVYNYIYGNVNCELQKVVYPDGKFKEYVYGSSSKALELVKDEAGIIIQKTTYNNSLRATSEGMGENGAIEKFSFNYQPTSVKITDANSNSTTATLQSINGENKIVGYNGFCPWCNGFQGSKINYDANGFISEIKDYKGVSSNVSYNEQGNVLTQTNALGQVQTYTYDTTGNFVKTLTTQLAQGQRITNYIYNENNQITNIKVSAPNEQGTVITKNYTMIYDSKGQVIEFRGAKYTNTFNDKMTLTYNNNGQVQSVTNGLNQTTVFSDYNDYGQPSLIKNADNSYYKIDYDIRGRVISSTFASSEADAQTTRYEYNNSGLLKSLIDTSGNYLVFTYDSAHRVTKVQEFSEPTEQSPNGVYNGSVEFTLDNMSNVVATKYFDKNGVEVKSSSAIYDNKNRLHKAVGSLNQTDTYSYDDNSNPNNLSEEGNYVYSKTYDALNRLQSLTNPDNGKISITYHPNDLIKSIEDAKGLITSYEYDGFDNLIRIVSPDTGTSKYSYDLNNNLVSKTDAKNNTTLYNYDVVGRVTSINTSSNVVTYTYDSCKVGVLCSIVDSTGTTTYTYNNKAQMISKKFIPKNSFLEFLVKYNYNNYGQLDGITYPSVVASGFMHSASTINYKYKNGSISSIAKSGVSLLNAIEYNAFSLEPKSFTQGLYEHSKTFSKDGLITSIRNSQSGSYNKNYVYDGRLNIKAINSISNPIDTSLSIVYDEKNRVIGTGYSESSAIESYGYSYNSGDDRVKVIKFNSTYNYNYPSSNHKLSSITGVNDFIYDANGSIVDSSNIVMNYDENNRLILVQSGNKTANYFYNALGQRVKKVVNDGGIATTWFIYNEDGYLMADYIEKNGVWTVSEYVYLYNQLVAVIKNGEVYDIQVDHLKTPRTITKSSNGQLVWEWKNKEVFGNNLTNDNIGNTMFEFNIRFMGQYWDNEKASSYNYYRDYAPGLGRYLQSDPIGLMGGINTYNYTTSNPLNAVDPKGLDKIDLLATSTKETGFWIKRSAVTAVVPKNVLGIISHGSWQTINDLDFKSISVMVQESDYFKGRVKDGKPILVDIMACQTGKRTNGVDSIAQNISRYLHQEQKVDVFVLAPTGNIVNVLDEQIEMINFSEKHIVGRYKIFKNGQEVYDGILKPNEVFKKIN